ncbi:MAG TPA: phosphohistidine phosphatase SixA [Planctomycetota bacterium]|nr:phosphohistidine phosphatase SixA [Planctomycetota bacterium]
MHIYLLRHGIANDAGPGVPDGDRALSEEGWKRLRRAAASWRELVQTPDAVLVSPLRRAQETARVLAEACHFGGDLRIESALVPEAPPQLALNLLQAEACAATKSIALVGHEPHLGYLLGLLLTGHPRQPIPLKKGMLVAVETDSVASLVAGLRFALTQKAAAQLG